MGKSYLIIDGYNLLHSAGLAAKRYGPGDLQRARQRLLKFLVRNLTPMERERATVVFDARDAPPDQPHAWSVGGMLIRFARPDGDADAMIEELIAAHASPKQILLVSSDHRLQTAARKRRAEFMDSDAFVADLNRRAERALEPAPATPPTKAAKPDGLQSEAELAEWLKVFGDVSPSEIERSLPRSASAKDRAQSQPTEAKTPKTTESPKKGRQSRRPGPTSEKSVDTSSEIAPHSDQWIQELQKWADELK